MQNKFSRNELDTLYIPIVFHNFYQMNNDEPFRSFCDYVTGYSEETWDYNDTNNPDICLKYTSQNCWP